MRDADSRMRWISTTVCGRTEQSGLFGMVGVRSVKVSVIHQTFIIRCGDERVVTGEVVRVGVFILGLSKGVDVGTYPGTPAEKGHCSDVAKAHAYQHHIISYPPYTIHQPPYTTYQTQAVTVRIKLRRLCSMRLAAPPPPPPAVHTYREH